jgi:hypothetical protein
MTATKLRTGRRAHKRIPRPARTLRDPALVARWLTRAAAARGSVTISRECALWLAEQLERLQELEAAA